MNQNNENPIDRLIAPGPLGILAATCVGAAGWAAFHLPDVIHDAGWRWSRGRHGGAAVLVAQPALAVLALLVAALVLWRIRAMMLAGGDGYEEQRRRDYDEPRGYDPEPAPRREYRPSSPQRQQHYDDAPLDERGDDGSDLPDTPQSANYGRIPEPEYDPPQHPAAPAPQRDRYQTYDSLLDGE